MTTSNVGCLTIAQVHLLDDAGKSSEAKDIIIRDGRIAAIVEAGAASEPEGRVVAGGGGFVVPGLWESHTHVLMGAEGTQAERAVAIRKTLRDYAGRGLTSVVDLGGSVEVFSEVRGAIATTAPSAAADFYFAGPVFTGVGGWPLCLHHDHALAIEIDDPADVEPLVASLDGRTDFIKVVYDGEPGNDKFPRDALDKVIDVTHRRGKRVMVHVRSVDDLTDAVAAGADCIEHCPIPQNPASLEEAKRAADRLAASQAYYCPTLVAWEQIGRSGDVGYLRELEAAGILTGAECEDQARSPSFGRPFPNHGADECRMRLDYGIRSLELMRAAGVRIVAGSDVAILMPRPAALFRELQLLAQGGLSNIEVLRSATSAAAARLGRPSDAGTLAVGAPADVLVLAGDPARSLDQLIRPEHLRAVVLHGERLDADA